jgi:hypothetical protein
MIKVTHQFRRSAKSPTIHCLDDGSTFVGWGRFTGRPSSSTTTNASAGDMLLQGLNDLLDEYVALLERLPEEHTVNIRKIVFMTNNLDQAVTVK